MPREESIKTRCLLTRLSLLLLLLEPLTFFSTDLYTDAIMKCQRSERATEKNSGCRAVCLLLSSDQPLRFVAALPLMHALLTTVNVIHLKVEQ